MRRPRAVWEVSPYSPPGFHLGSCNGAYRISASHYLSFISNPPLGLMSPFLKTMAVLWDTFFGSGSFIPHGHCYLWKPGLVWLHVVSDSLVAIAYFSIPLTLFYFLRRRKDLPFYRIFWLFALFIVACGTTHLMGIWTLWHPAYWLSGAIKALTAFVSMVTAVELVPIVPQALRLPSPQQLEAANQQLQAQIEERKAAEQELRRYQDQLETLVAERTAQLEASNQQMEALLEREQEARTQAEQANAEIQRYADRLTIALEGASMGLWDWDTQTGEIFWTPQQEIIMGYEPGQSQRTYEDWRQRVHPEDLEQVEAVLQAALTDQQIFSAEYRLILPDQDIRWVHAVGRAFYDPTGQAVRMVGILLDITKRKQFEESLQRSEATARQQLTEIEAIYASTPIGMCVLDRELRYVRLNEFLAEINGLPIEAHLGRTVQEVLPDLWTVQADFFEQALKAGEPQLDVEVRGTTPAQPNVERTWLVSYYPLRESGGEIIGINITAQEITERKRAEQALAERATELSQVNAVLARTTTLLQERNQELNQFAYVVSHDLKAPLRGIANLAEWIQEDLENQLPPDNQQQLQLMRKRVFRMEALINGLLDYSRVGRTQVSLTLVDLQALVQEVLDSIQPPDTFTIALEPGLPQFRTHRLRLLQVFTNLISNAIKHHDRPDGQIQITWRDRPTHYEFAVTDDGPGIAPQDHQRVFTIFQTLKPRDDQENTGVGLSIVKKIVETEGGEITLESALGEGTTFRFTWPKVAIASEGGDLDPPPSDPPTDPPMDTPS
jgi:PAS domain S-box-containing protein